MWHWVQTRPVAPVRPDVVHAAAESWPAAYGRIVAPEIIEQALARVDAARLRARLAGQPWRHTLVAEHEPAPAPDPTAPPVPVITGYASYGIERGVDGHPQQIRAAGGRDAKGR